MIFDNIKLNRRDLVAEEPIFIDNNSKIGILMLHGFASSPYEFKELGYRLSSKGFNLYAPLIAGHGTSPEEMEYISLDDMKRSVKNAYFKLKEKCEKIFIIGDSFGSNLGLWLAKELNNEPAGVLALNPAIFLKYYWFLALRLYTYGFLKKIYYYPKRPYSTGYDDMITYVTYSFISTKSLRIFFKFIRSETPTFLKKITVPVFIAHADNDSVVLPKSAKFVYDNINSTQKEIFWVHDNCHPVLFGNQKDTILKKIVNFIERINR